MKSTRKWFAGVCVALTLFGAAMVPTKAYADAQDVAFLTIMFQWMQGAMMSALQAMEQKISDKETQSLNDNANNIFKTQTDWNTKHETWEQAPASQGAVSKNMVSYETAEHANSFQNAQSYISYTQGTGSGTDATKYPVRVINNFNNSHAQIQSMNTQCNIDVPQAVGDATNNCKPQQLTYTNTMISSVNPIPLFPTTTLNTAIGQQYAAENKTNVVRTALSQLALNEATDPQTTKFIVNLQTAFTNPDPATINGESAAAVARDTLILNQARAMLELRLYESTLMNERLLATIVAQNEQGHLDYIRKLGAAQAKALQG